MHIKTTIEDMRDMLRDYYLDNPENFDIVIPRMDGTDVDIHQMSKEDIEYTVDNMEDYEVAEEFFDLIQLKKIK